MSAVRVITVPNGRRVTLGQYAQAWRALLQPETDLNEMVKGWDYFALEGKYVLRDMRHGLQDRINIRGNAQPRDLHPNRLGRKIRAAGLRGAIKYHCKWCGQLLNPALVNPHNASTRFCDATCRNGYYR